MTELSYNQKIIDAINLGILVGTGTYLTKADSEELIKHIAQLEAERNKLAEAVGLMTTLKPTMVVDSAHPVEMALEVSEYIAQLTAEIAEWKANAKRLIQLASFKNARAGEYFDLHEQLVKKYEVRE